MGSAAVEGLDATARRAANHGEEPAGWLKWMARVEQAKLDPETLAAGMHGDVAFWLAAWCFESGRDALGLVAYERVVAAHLEDAALQASGKRGKLAHGFNRYRTLAYGVVALRMGQGGRALRTLAPALATLGRETTDEILLALLQYLAGEADASSVLKVCARFARNPDSTVHVVRALALDAIGDREAGLKAILQFHAETGLWDLYARELASRYGAAFDEAIARPRPKPPKRVRTPGFVLKPSKAKTTHVFAPPLPPGPGCPDCGHAHRAWLSLDLTADPVLAPKLPGWSTFLTTACLDCGAWMRRHDLRVDARGAIVELTVEPGQPHAPFADGATRAIAPSFAKLAKATKKLEEEPLEGQCQLGGDPAWVQDPVDAHCPDCDAAMVFVARLASPNGFPDSPAIAGESGALYYFACGPCRRVAHIAQWT